VFADIILLKVMTAGRGNQTRSRPKGVQKSTRYNQPVIKLPPYKDFMVSIDKLVSSGMPLNQVLNDPEKEFPHASSISTLFKLRSNSNSSQEG
jgi:hypothetical protein